MKMTHSHPFAFGHLMNENDQDCIRNPRVLAGRNGGEPNVFKGPPTEQLRIKSWSLCDESRGRHARWLETKRAG
jgi:hypothetical protein